MVWEGLIFKNVPEVENLYEWGRFYTRYVSEIESDPVGDFTRTRAVFKVIHFIVNNGTPYLCFLLHFYFEFCFFQFYILPGEIVRTTKIRTSKTKKNSENHANHHNVEKSIRTSKSEFSERRKANYHNVEKS